MATRFPLRMLGLPEQNVRMAKLPGFRLVQRRSGSMAWEGCLQPTPTSTIYKVQIRYSPPEWPKVFVIEPEMMRRTPEERIPHLYKEGNLCLFLPFGHEWTGERSIVELVPWTSLWLVNYEAWLATGEWLGGGEHPAPRIPRRMR